MPQNGSIWVEGKYFHHLDENGEEWRFLGDLVTAGSPGRPGSIWPEGDFYHYIDEFGDERKMTGVDHGAVAGRQGSKWMESVLHRWAWIDQNTKKRTAHIDTHTDTHGDASVPHDDVAHSDVAHSNVAHSDSHGDNHSDTHGDVAHSDAAHYNTHDDFTDCHNDQPFNDCPHNDSHNDVAHSNVAHTNTHSDTHTDNHGNVAHSDVAHVDQHGDHNDHTDSHSDVTHDDRPEKVVTNTHIIFEAESRKRVRRRKKVHDD